MPKKITHGTYAFSDLLNLYFLCNQEYEMVNIHLINACIYAIDFVQNCVNGIQILMGNDNEIGGIRGKRSKTKTKKMIKWEDNESELEKEDQKMKNRGREEWRKERR